MDRDAEPDHRDSGGQRPRGAATQALFTVARNPDPESRLPYLLRLPVSGADEVVLATAVRWPGPKDAFCYEVGDWPEGAEVLEQVPVVTCQRVGVAIDLVLRRARSRRSMFVWTMQRRTGRRLIFWRTATTMAGARPGIRVPQARGLERALTVAVDHRERYAWKFGRYAVTLERRELPVGDYGVVVDEHLVAVVERKSAADLAGSAQSGSLAALLADLGHVPHAALVVEGRFSDLVRRAEAGGMRPGWLLNLVAALQATHPRVTWMFTETRDLAQGWAYRWLGACVQVERGISPLPGEPEPRGTRGAPAEPSRGPNIASQPAASAAEESATWPDGEESEVGTGTAMLDAQARSTRALEEARRGRVWTSAGLAEACGVSLATAWKDLRALVEAGQLVAEGGRRDRRYRAADQRPSPEDG